MWDLYQDLIFSAAKWLAVVYYVAAVLEIVTFSAATVTGLITVAVDPAHRFEAVLPHCIFFRKKLRYLI